MNGMLAGVSTWKPWKIPPRKKVCYHRINSSIIRGSIEVKAEFANPLIPAVVSTFQTSVGVKLNRNDLKSKSSPVTSKPISIIIGETGAVREQVVYSMELYTAMTED